MDKPAFILYKSCCWNLNLTEIHVTTLNSLFLLIVFKVIQWKLPFKEFLISTL